MLEEIEDTGQEPGESSRRWFSDSYCDLIVWEDKGGGVIGFQLCYGKGVDEHALTWRKNGGFTHHRVDDGEKPGLGHKSTPILVPDGEVSLSSLAEEFSERSRNIDSELSEFIYKKLLCYKG